ncbi:MAG: Outer-rane lipoprotein carrier protein precursor [Pseudomonadota bacterium]|jgi:outer membrane lipoprotein carrier protein
MRKPWQWGLGALAMLAWSLAQAQATQWLDDYLRTVRSGRAQFVQTVTSPARAGQTPRVKTSSGTFEFQRPGKFRFVYQRPYEQWLIADGTTLWLYDLDLQQVTARAQAQALGTSPAALLTSSQGVQGLQKDFALQDLPEADGLHWVQATPRAADAPLATVKAGLRRSPSGVDLVRLEVQDRLGQRSVLTFSESKNNLDLPAALFVFHPPAGTDVIRP